MVLFSASRSENLPGDARNGALTRIAVGEPRANLRITPQCDRPRMGPHADGRDLTRSPRWIHAGGCGPAGAGSSLTLNPRFACAHLGLFMLRPAGGGLLLPTNHRSLIIMTSPCWEGIGHPLSGSAGMTTDGTFA